MQEEYVFVLSFQFGKKMRTLLNNAIAPTKTDKLITLLQDWQRHVSNCSILIQEAWRINIGWVTSIQEETSTPNYKLDGLDGGDEENKQEAYNSSPPPFPTV